MGGARKGGMKEGDEGDEGGYKKGAMGGGRGRKCNRPKRGEEDEEEGEPRLSSMDSGEPASRLRPARHRAGFPHD